MRYLQEKEKIKPQEIMSNFSPNANFLFVTLWVLEYLGWPTFPLMFAHMFNFHLVKVGSGL